MKTLQTRVLLKLYKYYNKKNTTRPYGAVVFLVSKSIYPSVIMER